MIPAAGTKIHPTIQHKPVQSLSVVNDAAECALGLLSAFNTRHVTLDRKQHQILIKMVSESRYAQGQVATSSERTTKKYCLRSKSIKSLKQYKWLVVNLLPTLV